MRERFEKLHDILYAHYNGVLITLLACVMVIGTAIVITIQPMQTLISCQNIINEVGEDKVAGYQKSTGPSDLFDNQKETTYKDTNEYKEKQSEIDWMNKRINEIDNHLMTTLTRAVSDFADAYTSYSLVQNPANKEALSQYTTDDFYKDLCDRKVKKDNYLAYNCWFADFDKDTVHIFCETRDGLSYTVSLVETDTTGWRVNGFDILEKD